MLVQKIDALDVQTLQAAVDSRPDMIGFAVYAIMVNARRGVDVPAEFRCDLHLLPNWGNGLANHHLIPERAIGFGGIDKIHTTVYGSADQVDHLFAIGNVTGVTIAAQTIAPENADAFNAARRAAGIASSTAEISCRRLVLAGQSRLAHLREAESLLATLRSLAGAALAHTLACRTPDPASVLTEQASSWASAMRDTAAGLAMPASQTDDELGALFASVRKAVATYLAACRGLNEGEIG